MFNGRRLFRTKICPYTVHPEPSRSQSGYSADRLSSGPSRREAGAVTAAPAPPGTHHHYRCCSAVRPRPRPRPRQQTGPPASADRDSDRLARVRSHQTAIPESQTEHSGASGRSCGPPVHPGGSRGLRNGCDGLCMVNTHDNYLHYSCDKYKATSSSLTPLFVAEYKTEKHKSHATPIGRCSQHFSK